MFWFFGRGWVWADAYDLPLPYPPPPHPPTPIPPNRPPSSPQDFFCFFVLFHISQAIPVHVYSNFSSSFHFFQNVSLIGLLCVRWSFTANCQNVPEHRLWLPFRGDKKENQHIQKYQQHNDTPSQPPPSIPPSSPHPTPPSTYPLFPTPPSPTHLPWISICEASNKELC